MATTCCTHSFFQKLKCGSSSRNIPLKEREKIRWKTKENKKSDCQSVTCMCQRILRFHKYPGQLTLLTPQKVALPSLIPYLPVDIPR